MQNIFYFTSSHTDDPESRIISQAGKWANRHSVIFSLIERPHLSSKPTFFIPYLMQRLNAEQVLSWWLVQLVSDHHHHHHLMTLVSERGHSSTHRSSHGSKKVDKDLARVRLRRRVEEQARGDEHGDQQEEEPRGHHQHPAEPTTSSQPGG